MCYLMTFGLILCKFTENDCTGRSIRYEGMGTDFSDLKKPFRLNVLAQTVRELLDF